MKIILIIFVLLAGLVTGLSAQSTPEKHPLRSELFRAWAGRWQGSGMLQNGPGQPGKASIEESIQYKLDSTLLIIEGIGRRLESDGQTGPVVHQAFAVLSFDPYKKAYAMKSYLADGRSTDAWFRLQPDGSFQWGFEVPNVNMRYTINLDPEQQTWHEIGEYSRDGSSWFKVFEMNLGKVN